MSYLDQILAMERHPNLDQILMPSGLSRSSSSHFRSLTSAFYAAEHCMNFSDSINNFSDKSPQELDMSQPLITLDSSSKVINLPDENGRNLNTLESLLRSSHSCKISDKKSVKNMGKSKPIGRVFMLMQIESAAKNAASTCSFSRSQFIPATTSPKIEKQSAVHTQRIISFSSDIPDDENILGSSASGSTSAAGYTRFRWRGEPHERFVKCVNDLGGARKATPKEILKLMNYEGLTLFHVKSHLQKYRTSKQIYLSTEDALRSQIDLQKRLFEQLEEQRNLQLQIEEQRKQLQNMIDQIKKTGNEKSL